MPHVERGLFELRQRRAVWVTDPEGSVLLAPVEGLRSETLQRLRALGEAPPRLAVTRHRAAAMGLVPHPEPVSSNGRLRAVSLRLPEAADPDRILQLSTGPGKHEAMDAGDATRAESGGVALARLARLLPAVVVAPVGPSSEVSRLLDEGAVLRVSTEQIERAAGAPQNGVTPVSQALVPLEGAEHAYFMLFREPNGLFEHLAVLVGDRERWRDPVPVRLHSACVTGDLFGSLRCDCGEQLRGSLRAFVGAGGGVLLYLAHEGRSIGIANKLRAYAIQEEGLDTIDADLALGFGADERSYDAALGILRHLGITRIELLTNNPHKVRAMEDGGIRVVRRRPLHGTLTPWNLPYVRAKASRAGHWLEGMLAGGAPTAD